MKFKRKAHREYKLNPRKYPIKLTIDRQNNQTEESSAAPAVSAVSEQTEESTKRTRRTMPEIDWKIALENTCWALKKDVRNGEFREITIYDKTDPVRYKKSLGYAYGDMKSVVIHEITFRVALSYTTEDMTFKIRKITENKENIEYSGVTDIQIKHRRKDRGTERRRNTETDGDTGGL